MANLESRINVLAQRALDIEITDKEGMESASGLECWVYVFQGYSEDQVARLESMDGTTLTDFLMGDHSNDPAWELMQDRFGAWDECGGEFDSEEVGQ